MSFALENSTEMELDNTTPLESNEFWKDIPDDVLEELYKQLEQTPQKPESEFLLTSSSDLYPLNSLSLEKFNSLKRPPEEIPSSIQPPSKQISLSRFSASSLTSASFSSFIRSSSDFAELQPSLTTNTTTASNHQTPVSTPPTTPPVDQESQEEVNNSFSRTPIPSNNMIPTPNNRLKETTYTSGIPPHVQEQINRSRLVVENINQLAHTQDQQLEAMRSEQQKIILNKDKNSPRKDRSPNSSNANNIDSSLTTNSIRALQDQQWKLSQQIEVELKELQHLNRVFVLEPQELNQLRLLSHRLQIQQQTLELYKQELQQYLNLNPSQSPRCAALLTITEQPLPQVLFKGKVMEDSYVVKLILGSNQDVQSFGKVKGTLISEEQNWKSSNPVENDTTTMEPVQHIALFHNVKVNISTRMSMVHLKFSMQINSKETGTSNLESPISYPLIVITNESQWCDAAGKLLLLDAFSGQLEVPWPQFANSVHNHFLKATRQDPARPTRPIQHSDFHYIHEKFFENQPTVSQQQASNFWGWFGQVSQTLRFKRHINSLWFAGLIYGFITKNECNHCLINMEVGTFMIRFSESYPGLFAVAYVSETEPGDEERVKHYLIKPEDISSNKTLPDFLREKPQFQYIYQLDLPTGTMRKFAKDVVLGPYYSKGRKIMSSSNGYVLL